MPIIQYLLIVQMVLFSLLTKAQPDNPIPIHIDPAQTFQTIEGFGTCFVTFSRPPEAYNNPAFWDLVVNDLGLSLARIPMPEHMERNNDNDDPNVFNWDGYYVKDNGSRAGMERGMHLLQKLKDRGVDRFLATPWSPPDFMKTHRSPIMGGYLRADMLDEYAEYMAAYIILAKKNWDIDINAISIQNELLFIEPYRSCIYHPEMAREAVRALMHKFKQENIHTQIIMPEDMMFYDRMTDYITPTIEDPETRHFNGQFATHRQKGGEVLKKWQRSIEPYHRQTWMTETSGHQQTWEGAMALAEDIYEYLELGNFSAWIYWQISDNPGSGQYSLMVDGKPTSKYYVSKNFYRYIRPGAKRIKSTADDKNLLVTAYRHPVTGTQTTVIINKSKETKHINLSIDGLDSPSGFHIYQTTEANGFEDKGTLTGNDLTYTLPPKCVVTVTGRDETFVTQNEPKSWPEAWIVPEEVSQSKKWGNFKDPLYTQDWVGFNITQRVDQAIRQDKVNMEIVNGQTLLHQALLNGNFKAVDQLLKNGSDVNHAANDGWTPLHMAAGIFHEEGETSKYQLFKRIMKENPDIHATTDDGITPLHAAVMNAHTAWRQQASDNINRVLDLIHAGADVNAQDQHGRTPLHWAAWQGYCRLSGVLEVEDDIVKVLLENNANVNAQDDKGRTPLHYATDMGYPNIVYALMQHGAQPKVRDNDGNTPVDLARAKNFENIIYILKHNEMPEGTSGKKKHEEAGNGKLGPELLQAAWQGNVEQVKALLKKGADINYVDSDGFKPIDRARDNGHDEIVKMLEEAGKQ